MNNRSQERENRGKGLIPEITQEHFSEMRDTSLGIKRIHSCSPQWLKTPTPKYIAAELQKPGDKKKLLQASRKTRRQEVMLSKF